MKKADGDCAIGFVYFLASLAPSRQGAGYCVNDL